MDAARLALYRRDVDEAAVQLYEQLDRRRASRQNARTASLRSGLDAQAVSPMVTRRLDPATGTARRHSNPRRKLGIAILGAVLVLVSSFLLLGRQDPPVVVRRPPAVAQSVPLADSEQYLLRQLLTAARPRAELLDARTEGDVNQVLDTAGTVRADGSLTSAAAHPDFEGGVGTRRVHARIDLRRATRLRLTVAVAQAAEVRGVVTFLGDDQAVLVVQSVRISSGAASLHYALLQQPPSAHSAILDLASGTTTRIFWSLRPA